jgi:RHS repeat-associated protein
MLKTKLLGLILVLILVISPAGLANSIDFSCIDYIQKQLPNCPGTANVLSFGYDNSGSVGLGILCVTPQNPGYNGGQCSYSLGDLLPRPKTQKSDLPARQCGSIIDVDTLALGESVPLRGTPYALAYFSDRVIAHTADYTINIPVTDANPDPNVSSYQLDLSYADGRTETYTYASAANLSHTFIWDGKDSVGNLIPGSTNLSISVTLFYSSGPKASAKYTVAFELGAFKTAVVGLGGWDINVHRFFDILSQRLYNGDGTSRSVAVQLVYQGADGKIVTTLPPQGGPILNQVLLVGSEDGTEAYIFDHISGRHLETRSTISGKLLLSFSYFASGALQSITNSFGNITSIAKPSTNQVNIASPYGQITTMQLDTNGWAAAITDPLGRIHKASYSGTLGLISSFTKPRGQTSTITFDPLGFLQNDASAGGANLNFTRLDTYPTTASGLVRNTQMTTATGKLTKYETDFGYQGQFNRIQTDPSGASTTLYSGGLTGSIRETRSSGTIMTRSKGQDPRFGYNSPYLSELTLRSLGAYEVIEGTRTSLADPASDLLRLSGQTETQVINSNIWTTTYNGTSFKASSPLNRISRNQVNDANLITQTQRASFQPVNFSYDSRGRLQQLQQLNRSTLLTYDTNGYLASIKNAAGQITSFQNDASGQVLKQTLPDGKLISYTYDANGNLTTITPPKSTTNSFLYNLFDLLQEYLPPALTGVSNVKTDYLYDNDKKLTQITRPDGQVLKFNRDPITGLLTSVTLPSGTIAYTYAYQSSDLSGSLSPDGVKETYSAMDGILMNSTVAFPSLPTSITESLVYNNDLNIAKTTVAGVDIARGYDQDALITSIGNETLTRDPASGFLSATILGAVSETLSYDANYAELSSYSAKTTSKLYSENFTRDLLGRISTRTEVVGNLPAKIYAYSYDSQGRLTDVHINGAVHSHYVYSANSNRTSSKIAGVAVKAQYDHEDRLTTYGKKSYTYTANGDLKSVLDSSTKKTTSLTYDVLGNLKSVILPTGIVVSYLVDGLNRRSARLVNGVVQYYLVYENSNHLSAVVDRSGNILQRFAWGVRANLPEYFIQNGVQYKYTTDHVGSPVMVVNTSTGAIAQQITYDEFGQVIADTNPGLQPFGFAGGLYDQDTRLVHFGARVYDPETGRWLSKDPILFGGGDTNLMSYVANDPVNFVDPSGLSRVVFDRGSGRIYVYPSNEGTYGPPQSFPAGNNTVNPSGDPMTPESHGPAPNGTYPVGPYAPVNGGPNSSYGSGFFPIDLGARTGVGIHAGRENRGGPNANTLGCIRTNESGLGALRNDPPTQITIGN